MEHPFKHLITHQFKDAKSAVEKCNCQAFVDGFGATLLHYSAQSGNEEITQYLLEKHCDVNAQDKSGKTPLMMAVSGNYEVVVQMLLTAGADINVLNNDNQTALHMVLARHDELSISILQLFFKVVKQQLNDENIPKYLIDAGCHLYQAIFLKNTAVIEDMLLRGSPVDSRNPTDDKTALHLAVSLGHLSIVKLLLKYGADVNAEDNIGATPIYYLYPHDTKDTRGKLDILQVLLNSGVCLTQCTSSGQFQIGPALMKGDSRVIRAVLMHKDLDFAIRDNSNRKLNILHYLVANTNPGVVKELKFHDDKFDVRAIDETGPYGLLFDALGIGNIQMVKFLLEAGVDANSVKGYNDSPIQFIFVRFMFNPSFSYHYNQCFELLLQHGANFDNIFIVNDVTFTIFHYSLGTHTFNQMKTAVAHLAMVGKLGAPITDNLISKIDSMPRLKKYFKRYQRKLKRKITRSLTLFELLTDPKHRMARYVDNNKLVGRLNRLSMKNGVKLNLSYYCNIVEKRFCEGKEYQQASEAICKIFENHIDQNHLVTRMFMDYLDGRTLRALSQYTQMYR